MSFVILQKTALDDWDYVLRKYLKDVRGVAEEETLDTIAEQLEINLKEEKRIVFSAYLDGKDCGFVTASPYDEVLEVVALYVVPESYDYNPASELIKRIASAAFTMGFYYVRYQAKLPFNKEPSFEENLEKAGFKVIPRNEMFLELQNVLDFSFTLPEGYAFEPFSLERLDEIMQVIVASNPEEHPDYYIYPEFREVETAKQFLGNATDDFSAITPLLNPQIVFDNKIVGTSMVYTFPDKTAYIGDMSVHPDHQGKGLGKALLRNIILECSRKGVKKIGLAVTTSNNVAFKLYLTHGFQISSDSLAIIKQK